MPSFVHLLHVNSVFGALALSPMFSWLVINKYAQDYQDGDASNNSHIFEDNVFQSNTLLGGSGGGGLRISLPVDQVHRTSGLSLLHSSVVTRC